VIKIFRKWTFFFNTIIKLTFPKHMWQFINICNFNQWFDVFFLAIEFFQEPHSFHTTNFQQCEAFNIKLQQNLDTSWLCTIWISTFITFIKKIKGKWRGEKPRKQMREETSDMHNLMPSTKQLQRSQKVGTGHK